MSFFESNRAYGGIPSEGTEPVEPLVDPVPEDADFEVDESDAIGDE